MTVSKKYLGKYVEIQWRDPCFQRIDRSEFKPGRASLATWVERGMIIDVTDGVVALEHSAAMRPGMEVSDEMAFTPIPEEIIERITVYIPEPPDATAR